MLLQVISAIDGFNTLGTFLLFDGRFTVVLLERNFVAEESGTPLAFGSFHQNKFSFEPVALSDVVKEIKDINPNKSATKDSISPKMLKISSEATANILQKLLNESLETDTFPDEMSWHNSCPQKERPSK